MSEKKPEPIRVGNKREPCPVCGKPSFSLNGVHPQCALARADAIARAARKAAETQEGKPEVRKRWLKTCPKCKQEIPARRFSCECGHQFTAMRAGKMDGVYQQQSARTVTKPK